MRRKGKVDFGDYGLNFGDLDKPIKDAFAGAVEDSFQDHPCELQLWGGEICVNIPVLSEEFHLSFTLHEIGELAEGEPLDVLKDLRSQAARLVEKLDREIAGAAET